MYLKKYISTVLLAFIISYDCFCQEIVKNSFVNTPKKVNGDLIIEKSYLKISGSKAQRIFEFELAESNWYYLSAWCKGPELDTGVVNNTKAFNLSINSKQEYIFQPEGNKWSICSLKEGQALSGVPIELNAGKNQIIFSYDEAIIPEVECIALSETDTEVAYFEEYKENYTQFIDELKKNKLPVNLKQKKEEVIQSREQEEILKSASLDGEANYGFYNVSYNYTFRQYFLFEEGQKINFCTWSTDSVNPVMHFFYYDDPSVFASFSDDYFNDFDAGIDVTIPKAGIYALIIAAYDPYSAGLTTVSLNNVLWQKDVPVAGTRIYIKDNAKTGYLNFFTSGLSGSEDTYLYIEEANSNKIMAYNDNYHGSGDFDWGKASRIKGEFSNYAQYFIVTSNNVAQSGTCDVYINCENISSQPLFPNLKTDDAIQSAPANEDYNCASWAGGVTNLGSGFWPSKPSTSVNKSSPWYVSDDFWQSWDNFFGNNPPRWTNAPNYTRSGADSSNAEIAMWYNSINGVYTHFSVTKQANDQPHGYAWESKLGKLWRIFHPRDALNSYSFGGYGEIDLYYRRENTTLKSYSLKESVGSGLTVLQNVSLTPDEKELLASLKTNLPDDDIITFNNKFERLENKAKSPEIYIHSNPFFLFETNEFKEMFDYCRNKGEYVWPLLFEHIFMGKNQDEEDLSILLINEITPEYNYLMEEVKQEWRANNYTREGAYIAPSPVANTRNYIKKLLSLKAGPELNLYGRETGKDNHKLFSVYPNPFKHQTNIRFTIANNNSNVNLKVFDSQGKLIETIFANSNYNAGNQVLPWNADNYSSGLYFFNLTINGKSVNRRFLIE